MTRQTIIKSLLVVVMSITTSICHGQLFTYDHDASVMNQFTVGEVGLGAFQPDLYYDTFHKNYRNTAMLTNKQFFRMQMSSVMNQEESLAEQLDSAFNDRMRVELLNVADRTPGVGDLAWQFERGKIEEKCDIFKKNIERITIYGGSVQSYREWLDRYNAVLCGIDAIRNAYMPQGSRKEKYIEIYKDVIRLNKELHGYLSYLHSVKTVKYYITQNTGIVRPVDTSYVRRLATASRGRWKIALATASGL